MKVPRLTAVLKWTGLSLCILLFAAWFASGWFGAAVYHRRSGTFWEATVVGGELFLQVARGGLAIDVDAVAAGRQDGWRFHHGRATAGRAHWYWRLPDWGSWSFRSVRSTVFAVPLYMPITVLVLPAMWLFFRDRRSVRWARAGRCAGCGYDTAGLAAGAQCPECGKARA